MTPFAGTKPFAATKWSIGRSGAGRVGGANWSRCAGFIASRSVTRCNGAACFGFTTAGGVAAGAVAFTTTGGGADATVA